MANVTDRRVGNQYRRGKASSGYRKTGYADDSIDGNNARQLNVVPERWERPEPGHRHKRRPEKQPAKMAGIDAASFVFLLCALCIVVLAAFTYIHMQNNVRSIKKEVISMKTEVGQQQEENDIKYNDILAGVDLAEIYKLATEKLHMVMADSNKVYKYKNKQGDMVKQYADIPGAGD